MFLLNVVDNHGHGYPVGMFFVQSENHHTIPKALKMIQGWSPGLKPKVRVRVFCIQGYALFCALKLFLLSCSRRFLCFTNPRQKRMQC